MAEPVAPNEIALREPWWKGLTGYHWLVVVIASCGWLFDCMDQRIFVLSRSRPCGRCWAAASPIPN